MLEVQPIVRKLGQNRNPVFLGDSDIRMLLIEDERALGQAVHEHLQDHGHAVDWVMTLDDAEATLATVNYSLVLLDLHLPDGRGLDLLRLMRGRGDQRSIIILTARDQISDRIEGLNAGADDYLVKPFDLDELVARVSAVARRFGGRPSPLHQVGELEIDSSSRNLRRSGKPVELSMREWAVLDVLLQRPDATITKSAIEDSLYAFGAEVESNTVEVYVSRLRKKLGHDAIKTVRGLGYKLGRGQDV